MQRGRYLYIVRLDTTLQSWILYETIEIGSYAFSSLVEQYHKW